MASRENRTVRYCFCQEWEELHPISLKRETYTRPRRTIAVPYRNACVSIVMWETSWRLIRPSYCHNTCTTQKSYPTFKCSYFCGFSIEDHLMGQLLCFSEVIVKGYVLQNAFTLPYLPIGGQHDQILVLCTTTNKCNGQVLVHCTSHMLDVNTRVMWVPKKVPTPYHGINHKLSSFLSKSRNWA